MSLLRIENLRKSFGADVVLRDLSLEVPEHSATVLIGASGSGKSTLRELSITHHTLSLHCSFSVSRFL